MLEAGLSALLQADPGVQSACGGRITPLILDDDSPLPALSYQRISQRGNYALDCASLTVSLIQFDAFALRYTQAKELAAAVVAVLEGFHGALPDGTFVHCVSQTDSHDLYEDDPRSFRVSFDLRITHS